MQLNKTEKVLLNNFKNASYLLKWFLDEYVVKLHRVSAVAYLEMMGLTAVAFQEGTGRNLMNALAGIADTNVTSLPNGEVQVLHRVDNIWQVRITMVSSEDGMQVMVTLESKPHNSDVMEVDLMTNFTVRNLVE